MKNGESLLEYWDHGGGLEASFDVNLVSKIFKKSVLLFDFRNYQIGVFFKF